MKIRLKGFTLIELVVVTALIVTITAIALPSLLASKKQSNETSAMHYMKAWVAAQEMYYHKHGYYADADEQLVNAKLLTVTKGDGDGYRFALDNPPKSLTWHGRGWPVSPGTSGDRYFYISLDGVVHYAYKRQANKNDPSVVK